MSYRKKNARKGKMLGKMLGLFRTQQDVNRSGYCGLGYRRAITTFIVIESGTSRYCSI
uniref:Uncharacterized protein n=1 Tax=Meloidogyne incognita TaxID=6306 RepID=A0A914KZL7_MELIC